MDKLVEGLSKIAHRVAEEFEHRGRLLNNGVPLPASLLASPEGALGPLLWMTSEYTEQFELAFAGLRFYRSDEALTGYVLSSVMAGDAWEEVVVLTFADFLRHEVMGERVEEVDLGPLLENFSEWCLTQGASPVVSALTSPGAARTRQPD